jgi:gliding motility-associated-like protein
MIYFNSHIVFYLIVGFTCFIFSPSNDAYVQASNEEICDNALDDDGDGLIDLNDPDCSCEVVAPESLIPNPSFEDLDCCPQDEGELGCADGWIQASFPTTDFIHRCGWMGWDNTPDAGGSFPPPQPFPDGLGIVGFRDGVTVYSNFSTPTPETLPNWKEYAGACVTQTLEANKTYKIRFHIGFVNEEASPPIVITLFGHTTCESLPFGNATFENLTGCPTNEAGWVELGANFVSGGKGNKWVQSYIEFTPDENMNAVAIGPSCRLNMTGRSLYYFLDNLVLDEKAAFDISPEIVGSPCRNDVRLEIDSIPGLTYQWYKNGVALLGETDPSLKEFYGEGIYQIRTHDGQECKSSGEFHFFIPLIRDTIDAFICLGESYRFAGMEHTEEGLYSDTLKSTLGCDSIVTLNLQILGTQPDTIVAYLIEGDVYHFGNKSFTEEGIYDIQVQSKNGCLVPGKLNLIFLGVYFPNIFSPNGDGVNDEFTFTIDDERIYNVELSIYDRWGNKVNRAHVWDGRMNGQDVVPGVFTYVAKITLIDLTSHTVSGTVTAVQ